jgi:hypothetical protein
VRAVKVVLAGGSGQIGAILRRAFAGDEVVVIARSGGVRWDGRTLGPWAAELEGLRLHVPGVAARGAGPLRAAAIAVLPERPGWCA